MEIFSEISIKGQESIYTLVINRPEKKNILSPLCLREIEAALSDLSTKSDLKVLVIRGGGDEAFCAGYDMAALPSSEDEFPLDALDKIPPLEKALSAIESFPYPVLAMMNGYAYGGGCELALSCDIRIAARKVRISMTALKIGLVYPYKGFERFIRKIGLSSTLEIFLTAKAYTSEECLRMGLVNAVVEDEDLEEYTYELAARIASYPQSALKGTKRAIYTIGALQPIDDKAKAELEYYFKRSLLSQEHLAIRRAFLERKARAKNN